MYDFNHDLTGVSLGLASNRFPYMVSYTMKTELVHGLPTSSWPR